MTGVEPGTYEQEEATQLSATQFSPTQLSVLPSPAPPATGVPPVDAAIARLETLGVDHVKESDLNGLDERVRVYELVQRDLNDVLVGRASPDDSDPAAV